MKTRPLSRADSHQLLCGIEAHGMNDRLFLGLSRKDKMLLWRWMMALRTLSPALGEAGEESAARRIMGPGKYFGPPEAYRYFGEEVNPVVHHRYVAGPLKRHALLQRETLESFRDDEYILIWMPEISLRMMRSFLPQDFFPSSANGEVWRESWSTQMIRPGFRFMRASLLPDADDKDINWQRTKVPFNEDVPHPCELAYLSFVVFQETGCIPFDNYLVRCQYVLGSSDLGTGYVRQRFSGRATDRVNSARFRFEFDCGRASRQTSLTTCRRVVMD